MYLLKKFNLVDCLYRVNCYDALSAQAPFGGYKMSGVGRELLVLHTYNNLLFIITF